ncbi:LysR substrate-binding domain-containing protein [Allorhizobium pseudoryzae]|uniref:LysR family transcriptional regulator n=1 Tax=Allorhizobium pseudoryzae TaxID=379684 RepID=UPI0013EC69C6
MKTSDPLNGLAVFLAVAEHLSFTKAAEILAMSRPTVSAQVDQLERRLGVRLLHRSTRHLSLTEAGAAFHDRLRNVTAMVQEAERAAMHHQAAPVGRLRISAPPDLGSSHLTPMIARFLADHPEIEIELELSNSAVNLIERKFDLAVRGTLRIDETLITRKLGESAVVICASPDYLSRHAGPEHPEDLADHRCLHFSGLRWGRNWEMRQGEDLRRVQITPSFEVNDGRNLCEAALCGLGITLLPTFVVGSHIRAGRLVRILADWHVAEVPLHAVYPDNRLIAAKVKSFVSYLADEFRRDPDLSGAVGRAPTVKDSSPA